MREKYLIEVDADNLLNVLFDLNQYIDNLMRQARRASNDPRQEKQILQQAAEIYGNAAELVRPLKAENMLRAIPSIEDNRRLACCPACGQEDYEDISSEDSKILRNVYGTWSEAQVHELLPNPAQQEHVAWMAAWKWMGGGDIAFDRFKTVAMECKACQHREETLATGGMSKFLQHMPDSTRKWWTTQHPEILMLSRWQVPESRIVLFQRRHLLPSSQF